MNSIRNIIKEKNIYNVNVDKDIYNNVYDENVAIKIKTSSDKHKAIGEIIAEKLEAPHNIKLYIGLSYKYSQAKLFECLALTEEANREGKIRFSKAQYFYGIIRRQKDMD